MARRRLRDRRPGTRAGSCSAACSSRSSWAAPSASAAPLALTACLLLAAFGVFQLLSIAWAGAKGDAWDAANRTFVYAFVFLPVVGWRGTPQARQALILLFGLGMAVLGVATLYSAANHVGVGVPGRTALGSDRLRQRDCRALPDPVLGRRRRSAGRRGSRSHCARSRRSGRDTRGGRLRAGEPRGAVHVPGRVGAPAALARHRAAHGDRAGSRDRTGRAASCIRSLAPTRPRTTPLRAAATHHAATLAILCGIVAAFAAAGAALVDDRARLDSPRWLVNRDARMRRRRGGGRARRRRREPSRATRPRACGRRSARTPTARLRERAASARSGATATTSGGSRSSLRETIRSPGSARATSARSTSSFVARASSPPTPTASR